VYDTAEKCGARERGGKNKRRPIVAACEYSLKDGAYRRCHRGSRGPKRRFRRTAVTWEAIWARASRTRRDRGRSVTLGKISVLRGGFKWTGFGVRFRKTVFFGNGFFEKFGKNTVSKILFFKFLKK
jgi:hypothetical protein